MRHPQVANHTFPEWKGSKRWLFHGAVRPREEPGSQHGLLITAQLWVPPSRVNIALACSNRSCLCMKLCFTMKPEHSADYRLLKILLHESPVGHEALLKEQKVTKA